MRSAGSWKPLIELIAAGKIRGAVGIVGCNNPKVKHDYGHVTLAKELIQKNILCVETGCAAIASGKAGLFQAGSCITCGRRPRGRSASPSVSRLCSTWGPV